MVTEGAQSMRALKSKIRTSEKGLEEEAPGGALPFPSLFSSIRKDIHSNGRPCPKSRLFLLWLFPVTVKPGTCPPDDIRCIRAEPNECAQDSDCRGNQKCCHSYCALRCLKVAIKSPSVFSSVD
uniref:WAP domain-containing protein n=1 Tax=Pelusios castaneus TaxID=367368 RepID=A0A8C8SG84_9SAUR